MEFKDAVGQLLSLGDFVVFSSSDSQDLSFGMIIKFTPKMVRIKLDNYPGETVKDSSYLFKAEGHVIESYLASRGILK